ncbi:MAG: hypothetical protein GMKNLPBB_02480 [Myxococcota bacterium]|nr:hypothetical protein [Myxococcota bacterium]
MKTAGLTDTGKKRRRNEDAFGLDDELRLYIVADGMGGYSAGNWASENAVKEITAFVRQKLGAIPVGDHAAVEGMLRDAFLDANTKIHSYGRNQLGGEIVGTTCVAALIREGVLYVAHVGDSRLYRFRQGKLERLTKDHSKVQQLVDAGQITEEEAEHHIFGNIITRSLGGREHVAVETQHHDWNEDHALLLFSDGLRRVLSDQQISEVLFNMSRDPAAKVKTLVDRTNDGGAPDNVTVVLIEGDGFPKVAHNWAPPAPAPVAPSTPVQEIDSIAIAPELSDPFIASVPVAPPQPVIVPPPDPPRPVTAKGHHAPVRASGIHPLVWLLSGVMLGGAVIWVVEQQRKKPEIPIPAASLTPPAVVNQTDPTIALLPTPPPAIDPEPATAGGETTPVEDSASGAGGADATPSQIAAPDIPAIAAVDASPPQEQNWDAVDAKAESPSAGPAKAIAPQAAVKTTPIQGAGGTPASAAARIAPGDKPATTTKRIAPTGATAPKPPAGVTPATQTAPAAGTSEKPDMGAKTSAPPDGEAGEKLSDTGDAPPPPPADKELPPPQPKKPILAPPLKPSGDNNAASGGKPPEISPAPASPGATAAP